MEFYYAKGDVIYGVVVTKEVMRFFRSNLILVNIKPTYVVMSMDKIRCALSSVLDIIDPLKVTIYKRLSPTYSLELRYSDGNLTVESNYSINPYEVIEHVRSQFQP